MKRNLWCTLIALMLTTPVWAAEEEGVFSRRIELARKNEGSSWLILPYRPNYILPVTYSFNMHNDSLRALGEHERSYDGVEIKFQISFMLGLAQDLVGGNGDLYLGYSQVSFWNAYNSDLSAPFRDTNYEPELFMVFDTDYDVFGMKNRTINVGLVHESNGRGASVLSRSWNRVYLNFLFERGNFVLNLKPWWRFPEDDENDENPGMEKYYGYGELGAYYKRRNQVFSAMLRNNLRSSGNKGAIELGWSFPLHGRFKGYVQYFNGYGETLLDYDVSNQRVGLGVMLSDWL